MYNATVSPAPTPAPASTLPPASTQQHHNTRAHGLALHADTHPMPPPTVCCPAVYRIGRKRCGYTRLLARSCFPAQPRPRHRSPLYPLLSTKQPDPVRVPTPSAQMQPSASQEPHTRTPQAPNKLPLHTLLLQLLSAPRDQRPGPVTRLGPPQGPTQGRSANTTTTTCCCCITFTCPPPPAAASSPPPSRARPLLQTAPPGAAAAAATAQPPHAPRAPHRPAARRLTPWLRAHPRAPPPPPACCCWSSSCTTC